MSAPFGLLLGVLCLLPVLARSGNYEKVFLGCPRAHDTIDDKAHRIYLYLEAMKYAGLKGYPAYSCTDEKFAFTFLPKLHGPPGPFRRPDVIGFIGRYVDLYDFLKDAGEQLGRIIKSRLPKYPGEKIDHIGCHFYFKPNEDNGAVCIVQ
ncbi:hypothetical protein Y032_0031g2351 [Ancylostoma ceylanicum]|uniref:Uncharacterized protein n=1 Tax=Ancylostoma ceylanicum TaxID=53326 RepID=A0A016UQW5_9BILA|nr:hypothetical protein Y032_0031g2351 [Ancylostoma ceylanicum]